MPDDATVVVVAGPKTDYFAPEVDALRAFLKKGGKLLLLLDPGRQGRRAAADESDRAGEGMGRRPSATTSSSTRAAWDG